MALVRWSPSRETNALQGEIDRLFDGFFGAAARRDRRWVPATDLVETKDHLVLRADLPGVSEEDVSVEIKDRMLTISGERKDEHNEENEGYYRFERVHGQFARSLAIPDGIDPEQVDASFDRGVLEVRIPKPAERKPHRVAIGRGAEAPVEGEAEEK
jgi:HSP20 family protein